MLAAVLALTLQAAAAPPPGAADAAAPSDPARWLEIEAEAPTRAFLDRSSMRLEGGLVRYRGRIVLGAPDANGVVGLNHEGEIDCARRTFRILGYTALDPAGRVIVSHGAGDSEAIGAGSANEGIRAEFCPAPAS